MHPAGSKNFISSMNSCKDGFQAWPLDVDTRVCCGCLKYYGVAIDPAVDGKRSRVGLGFGVGLGVLLG